MKHAKVIAFEAYEPIHTAMKLTARGLDFSSHPCRDGTPLERGSTNDACVPRGFSGPAKDPNRWQANSGSPACSSVRRRAGGDNWQREIR